jgi:hypothetical protein
MIDFLRSGFELQVPRRLFPFSTTPASIGRELYTFNPAVWPSRRALSGAMRRASSGGPGRWLSFLPSPSSRYASGSWTRKALRPGIDASRS